MSDVESHLEQLRTTSQRYRDLRAQADKAYADMVKAVNAAYDKAGMGGERIGRTIGLGESAVRQIRKRSLSRNGKK